MEDQFYLTSLYWGAENGLYWRPDVVFHDDALKIRLVYARQNWVSHRHVALTLVRRPGLAKEGSRATASMQPSNPAIC
jgi:predicted transposase YbfD/YdcC